MRCRDFFLALALLYAFDTASLALQHDKLFWSRGLSICCVVEMASWLFSFFGFLFEVLWLRPSTGDTLRLLLRRAAGRLQTEISHADRDFSLAVAVLHAFDVASLPLQHQKAKGGVFARIRWRRSRCNIKRSGGLSLSSAKRLLCGSTGDFVVSFFFWGVFCPRFFVLRPSTGDTLRLRLRRAASPLQTDISLSADRDFSLALAVLHAVDVHVARVVRCKCQRGDSVAQQR